MIHTIVVVLDNGPNIQIIVLDNGPNIPRLTLENSQPIIDLNALQVAQGIPNDMEGQRE